MKQEVLETLLETAETLDDSAWRAIAADEASTDLVERALTRPDCPPLFPAELSRRWDTLPDSTRALVWSHLDDKTRSEILGDTTSLSEMRAWIDQVRNDTEALLYIDAAARASELEPVWAPAVISARAEVASSPHLSDHIRANAAYVLFTHLGSHRREVDAVISAVWDKLQAGGCPEAFIDALGPPECATGDELRVWVVMASTPNISARIDCDSVIDAVIDHIESEEEPGHGNVGAGDLSHALMIRVRSGLLEPQGEVRDRFIKHAQAAGTQAASDAIKTLTGRRPSRNKQWNAALTAATNGELEELERLISLHGVVEPTSAMLQKIVADPSVPDELALVAVNRFAKHSDTPLSWRPRAGFAASMIISNPTGKVVDAAAELAAPDMHKVLAAVVDRDATGYDSMRLVGSHMVEQLAATPGANLAALTLRHSVNLARMSRTVSAELSRVLSINMALGLELVDTFGDVPLGDLEATLELAAQ